MIPQILGYAATFAYLAVSGRWLWQFLKGRG